MPPKQQQPRKQLTAEQLAARRARRKAARQRRAAAHKMQVAPQLPRPQAVVKAMQVVKRNVDSKGGRYVTKMMMLPGESQPVRLPTTDMPQVALVQTRQIRNYDEVTGPFPIFGNNSYVGFVYGLPSLTHMDGPYLLSQDTWSAIYFEKAGQDTTEFRLKGLKTESWTLRLPAFEQTLIDRQEYDFDKWWPIATVEHGPKTWQPNRPLLRVGGVDYVFLNVGEHLYVGGSYMDSDLSGSPISGALQLGVYCILDRERPETLLFTHDITIGPSDPPGQIPVGRINIDVTGWFAIKAQGVTIPNGQLGAEITLNFTILHKANEPLYKLHYIPEIQSTMTIANDCRRTALSLLVSNRSNQFIAQGSVVAGRLPMCFPGTPEGDAAWVNLASAKQAFSGNAQKGCYTYCEFDHHDEEFQDFVNPFGNPICYWTQGMVNLITINNRANGGTSSNNMYTTVCDSVIEFRSQSQLFPAAVSTLGHDELIEARRINNMTTYFYENPLHWADIQKYIGKMWNWTRAHSTGIGSALSLVYPEAAPAIMPVARFLQT